MTDSATDPVAELLSILDLEKIEENIFRGVGPNVGWQRVYGGLVVAQSLVAAERTVEGRAPHSMHCYFLLGGDPTAPIVYEVERVRDGRSFTTRRVLAIQHGRPIFSMSASFHVEEEGLEHAFAIPEAPDPDSLPSQRELAERFGALMPENVRRYLTRPRPFELRPVDLTRYLGGGERRPEQKVWLRALGPLPESQATHRAILAYLSDLTLLDTALVAHGRSIFSNAIQAASLDHAIWFHRPIKADEWMLYVQDSPFTGGARGLTRGQIFSREGSLLASFAQEGLIRLRKADSPKD
ncbi:MAG: acyl-CoA thioesterase II [Methylobacteriaceae bacterium]|nr:acyl-CoA thioesterase II [Methylobacteriaceae bacterium]